MSDIDKKAVLEHINAILAALGEEPVSAEKQEQESKTWPQVGEEYWCTADWRSNGVFKAVWRGDEVDHFRFASGDCRRTEAEALAYREWQTDPRVVARSIIERMEGFDPQGDYSIECSIREIITIGVHEDKYNGGINFDKRGQAKAAIDKYPDLCKVALGVITDKEEGSRIVREAMGDA